MLAKPVPAKAGSGYPVFKATFYDFVKFGILNFGHCDLFGICVLLFEIFYY